jgi:hypothetical protein
MKALSDRLKEKASEKASKYRNWALENWASYTLLRNLFLLFLFPAIYLITQVSVAIGNPDIGWFSLLLFLPIFAFVLLDSKRVLVVEKSPVEFIKAEKVERNFEILFYIQIPLWLIVLVIYANSERIGISKDVLPSFQTLWVFLVLAWTGSLMSTEMSLVESSTFITVFKKRFVPKSKWHLFEFSPSENARARARFVVVSNFLSNNPNNNAIGRKFKLFYQGIKIYNDHLKDDFGFVLREPKRLYCQAKLAAYSKDNVVNIKNGLESLTELMKDENSEPFEIIKSLKEMLNEQASFKEVCAEIDADPERIKKWFSVHSDLIIGIVGIILGIVELLIFLLVFR